MEKLKKRLNFMLGFIVGLASEVVLIVILVLVGAG